MDKKGFNYGLYFGLGFVAMIVSSIFAALADHAELNLDKTTYRALAGLPALGLSIGLARWFWRKDSSGNYMETSFWRWLCIAVVIFGVLVLLCVILVPITQLIDFPE